MVFYLMGNSLVIIIKQLKEFMSNSLIQHSDNGIKAQFSPSFLDSRSLALLSAWLVLGELTAYPSPRSFSVYCQQEKEKVKTSLSQKPWQNILFCPIGCAWGTFLNHHDG